MTPFTNNIKYETIMQNIRYLKIGDINLTEEECGTAFLAIIKCCLIRDWLKAGLTVTLNKKNFGFPETDINDELVLLGKLDKLAKIAYLREKSDLNHSGWGGNTPKE